ncbi:MAG: hypothetical protein ACXWQZ_09145 [Ktedonobacterales bacterium]
MPILVSVAVQSACHFHETRSLAHRAGRDILRDVARRDRGRGFAAGHAKDANGRRLIAVPAIH